MESTPSRLALAVRNFDRDACAGRTCIRDLLESDPEAFYDEAFEILREPDGSRGSQQVIAMLLAGDLLQRTLCDPRLTLAQALEVARVAFRLDPMTDVALAQRLVENATPREPLISAGDAGRLMDILEEITEGERIRPMLMRLLRHQNSHIRSKAVKLVGRGAGKVKWVRSRLEEADPRVRANAIEALWGVDSEEARELLWTAAHDANNRVAGNALIALYRLGDCSAIAELFRMAGHSSAPFRSTAAWGMGETGDPRFTEALGRLLREPHAAVRRRAMSALSRIKAAVSQSRQMPRWMASGLLLESDPQQPLRRLQLAVSSGDGTAPRILPTQFLLCEDGRQVLDYKVTEGPAPDAMSVIFLFPRTGIPGATPWARAALRCRAWKRGSDLWAIQHYTMQDPAGISLPALELPPRYTANLETLTRALTLTPSRAWCTGFWDSVWSAVRPEQPQARGRRHLILFCNAAPAWPPDPSLMAAVRASPTAIHAISFAASAPLEELCRGSGHSLRVTETAEAAEEAVAMAYLNLLSRYGIAYQSTGPATSLKIRVNGSEGWAETTLPLPEV